MHKKVLQNAHFKNRFALQTDGEIGQSDRFETAPPNQKQGWNKIYYHYCPVKAGKSVFEIVET